MSLSKFSLSDDGPLIKDLYFSSEDEDEDDEDLLFLEDEFIADELTKYDLNVITPREERLMFEKTVTIEEGILIK